MTANQKADGIQNQRQYLITRTQIGRFEDTLRQLQTVEIGDPLLRELHSNAIQSQLDDLKQQMRRYERLQSGRTRVFKVDSFDGLPKALIEARAAAGMTQKQLADRLGLKEQQIQRYEKTGYGSASLSRIQEVADALRVKTGITIQLRAAASTKSRRTVRGSKSE